MLIQLSNGDWIDPRSVARVAAGRTDGRRSEPHVVIEERDRTVSLPCKTDEEAAALRDRFAAEVNAALAVPPP